MCIQVQQYIQIRDTPVRHAYGIQFSIYRPFTHFSYIGSSLVIRATTVYGNKKHKDTCIMSLNRLSACKNGYQQDQGGTTTITIIYCAYLTFIVISSCIQLQLQNCQNERQTNTSIGINICSGAYASIDIVMFLRQQMYCVRETFDSK